MKIMIPLEHPVEEVTESKNIWMENKSFIFDKASSKRPICVMGNNALLSRKSSMPSWREVVGGIIRKLHWATDDLVSLTEHFTKQESQVSDNCSWKGGYSDKYPMFRWYYFKYHNLVLKI